MKHLRKFVSILLTAIMVLAMCIPVMADDTTTSSNGTLNGTITMENVEAGHTYSIYQILVGKYDASTKVLSDAKWGSATEKYGQVVSETEMKNLVDLVSETEQNRANSVANLIKQGAASVGTINSENLSVSVPTGYYVIKDSYKDAANVAQSVSTNLVQVVGNVTISPKIGVPTSEKKVDDKNDSNNNEDGVSWQDSADYDIGDKVPFQLHGTLPQNFDSYTSYQYIFHDNQSAGLTFNQDSVVVKINDKTISSNCYSVNVPGTTHSNNEQCTFEIKFANLKQNITDTKGNPITVTKNDNIYVEYNSTLNEKAVIGEVGNPNEMYLEYSSNPNAGGEEQTDKTPTDKVIVFTYKLVVNKVERIDENLTPLKGAGFTLYKYNENLKAYEVVKVNTDYKVDINGTLEEIKGDELTSFTWIGLDDGKYKLSETTTPSGYNTLTDQYFTVTAEHKDGDDPKLTSLSGNKEDGSIIEFAHTESNKKIDGLSTNIENKKGSLLPTTGGIGTTIFYIVGVVLVLGAGVLLVTKKRMNADK